MDNNLAYREARPAVVRDKQHYIRNENALSIIFGSSGSLYWHAIVVQRRRLNNDTECADEGDGCEQQEHEPIKHHRHELPVLLHLRIQQELDRSHLLQ